MKRPNRTVNIFSVSALDLFASAMGAFIILTLILVPFYRNTATTDDIDAVRSALADAQQDLQSSEAQLVSCQEARAEAEARADAAESRAAAAQAEADDLRERLENQGDAAEDLAAALAAAENLRGQLEQANGQLADCRRRLGSTFLIAVMTWREAGQDIDMHVFDPEGRHFYYEEKRYPGTDGELSFDNTIGPGVEVWQHPSPELGRYTFCYHFFGRPEENPGPRTSTIEGVILGGDFRFELPVVSIRLLQDILIGVAVVDENGVDRVEPGAPNRPCPFPVE